MKLTQLLALMMGLALAGAPLARAQETEIPTESPSPTPTEKAETKKSDEETKPEAESASAEKSATPVAKAQKKEKPARSMARGSMAAELKSVEERWEGAFMSHDAKVVEEILADNYVLTNDKGKVLNRRGALKEFKKNTDTLEKATNSDVVVHPINHDAAVVTGMSHEVGKEKGGKSFDRTYRWTDTYVNRNGKWQCVASHVTLVGQK
jgi:ketosteroid isomerase-like protein